MKKASKGIDGGVAFLPRRGMLFSVWNMSCTGKEFPNSASGNGKETTSAAHIVIQMD